MGGQGGLASGRRHVSQGVKEAREQVLWASGDLLGRGSSSVVPDAGVSLNLTSSPQNPCRAWADKGPPPSLTFPLFPGEAGHAPSFPSPPPVVASRSSSPHWLYVGQPVCVCCGRSVTGNGCPSPCEQRSEPSGAMGQVRPLVTDAPGLEHLVLISAPKTLEHSAGFALDKHMLQARFNGCKTNSSGAH